MQDPSRMIKGMQERRSVVPVFGDVSNKDKDEVCSYSNFILVFSNLILTPTGLVLYVL
ncbi:hypothetical protein Hanom_Chr02g00127081 [Helianthus anomalus]